MRRLVVTLTGIGLLVVPFAAAVAAERLSAADQKAADALGAPAESGPLVVHFDAAELKGDALQAAIRRNRGFYDEVQAALGVEPPEKIHVFAERSGAAACGARR